MTTAQDTREAFVQGLLDAGEKGIAGEDRAWLDAYFAPEFTFHGPDGAELDYAGLQGFWAALRAAFDDLTITRGIMVVEGNYIAQGRLVEEWVQTDQRSQLRQLGAEGR